MSPPRRQITALAKLLDRSSQPIYALDEQWRIVYCNQPCLRWVACEQEELLGRRCTFRSGHDVHAGDAIAAGLCPPPDAAEAPISSGIVSCLRPDGQLSRRGAVFLALASNNEPLGLLAIVAAGETTKLFSLPGEANRAAESRRLHEELRDLHRQLRVRHRVEPILGPSPHARRLRKQVEAAAELASDVVLVGPVGSGRKTLAGTIHYGGAPQAAGPFIPLPCADVDADVMESTIQALAGAHEAGRGRPSLLLEDVDRLSPDAQRALWRLTRRDDFPFRLLCTAESRPAELAAAGQFREDLAAHLSTFVIDVPPLARRRDDIPHLAQAVLERRNTNAPRQFTGFEPETLDVLVEYPWPGNFDELRWAIDRACQRAPGPLIAAESLPRKIRWARDDAVQPPADREAICLPDFLAQVECELIERALRLAKGNKSQAARLLGLNRPKLYRRLIQLGLEDEPTDKTNRDT